MYSQERVTFDLKTILVFPFEMAELTLGINENFT